MDGQAKNIRETTITREYPGGKKKVTVVKTDADKPVRIKVETLRRKS